MSINVIVHDTRLDGRTPLSSSSFVNFDVGEDTPLREFFEHCSSIAAAHGGISTLYLMAHGAEMEFAGRVGGGYGIIFCREFIQMDNVAQFTALLDKVEQIVLLVCAAAGTSVDFRRVDVARPELSRTFHGDGNELCRQMAISAHVPVTAAREIQAYSSDESCSTFAGHELFCTSGFIDFGDWEGSVVRFSPNGDIVAQWTNPSAWRDSDGVIHDPRIDPRR
ncbi:MAG TPA: hypothetical protein VK468_00530 [Pyrinomonadaceae bacterium]|nr:hypothetical protein [Pyrinomonadaceae bacterium]